MEDEIKANKTLYESTLSSQQKTAFTKKPSVKRENRLKTVLLLLEHGADVDAEDSEGSTPLHYAFYSKKMNEPLTQLLLPKSQLNRNLTNHHGISYLHIASTLDLSAVETLMKNGGSVQSSVSLDCDHFGSGYSALHFAVSFNKLEIVQYLLEHGVDPNVEVDGKNDTTTALHIASSCEIPNFGNMIRQTDPVTDIQTYLTNRSHIITTLLKYGASVNHRDASGDTPLLIASLIPGYFQNVENEEYIQDEREESERSTDNSDSDPSESSRPEPKKEKFPPLLKSKILERLNDYQISTIKLLLQHGADIHLRNDSGETILHKITSYGQFQQKKTLAEMVLKKGADVNAVTPDGLAPLHYIISSCLRHPSELPLFELFCEYGVDINAHSSYFGTPLHMIARSDEVQDKESVEDAQKLLELILCHPTVDLNIRNKSGDTPLHVAARIRYDAFLTGTSSSQDSDSPELTNENCVIELLSAGADIFIKNAIGLTPFQQLYNRLMDVFATAWDRFFIRDHSYLLISVITHLKKLIKINFPMSHHIEKKLYELSSLCPKILSTIDAVLEKEIDSLKTTTVKNFTRLTAKDLVRLIICPSRISS
ncbi:hypothetical protein QAD02_006310 [Eretmocerus hayati]|uniref:Uncharacterized protein n=1 Tax=Eretmocerus hayati TaxID=131215 RepID=A0ACC2N0Z4_9HYME|nr:hypothetical protein QAD02_006310 [Eretmocerus hayati]